MTRSIKRKEFANRTRVSFVEYIKYYPDEYLYDSSPLSHSIQGVEYHATP